MGRVNNHGGQRKGAGRKKNPVPAKVINFRIDEPIKENFDNLEKSQKREIREKVKKLIESEVNKLG